VVLEVTTSRHVLNFHWQVLLKTDGTELANMWQLTGISDFTIYNPRNRISDNYLIDCTPTTIKDHS
jgi:hypothetical protein